MVVSPGKASQATRRLESQALVTVVPCGRERGLAGVSVVGAGSAATGEHFVPFAVGPEASAREYGYAGLIAAIERLRSLAIERVLIVIDDEDLVADLERRAEPPRDLALAYIILGCKLNEFRKAKVVAARSSRLEQLLRKAEMLAATVYNAPPSLARAG